MNPTQQTQQQTAANKPLRLFARREKIFPRRVDGRYRRLKWLTMAVTLSIYYLAPLIRWDRGANAPHQAILIDLPARRAYWFFIEIWPQEVYYLTAILIFAAIGLFFVTSLLGRVWCGYFCPQTVWTDLYMMVENMVQGDRNARVRLDKKPLCFEKIWKKGLTHILWLLIALLTAGAFVFYFNDAPALWRQVFSLDISPTVAGFVAALTFSTYLMAGFAREQVCTYMCPYARFQSAMFDRDTLIIGYDTSRGEPRGKHKAGESWNGRGHCIDCTACVQVCPMGIDIRKGLQMECIACGLCVDACNDVMNKLALPRGLIRYDTEKHMEAPGTGAQWRLIRPRTIYYMLVLSVVAGLVLYGQVTRRPYELHVLHTRNPLYVALSDGQVRNGYEIKILNKTHSDTHFSLALADFPGAALTLRAAAGTDADDLAVRADSVGTFHAFITATPQPQGARAITIEIRTGQDRVQDRYETVFMSRRTSP